jgi:hypothetical protein
MIINHPLLGPRDANEFIHLGDESMIDRPDGMDGTCSKEVFTITFICVITQPVNIVSFGIMRQEIDPGWL